MPGWTPPHIPEAGRKSPEQWPGEGQAAVGEQVAAAGADHAGLGVGVEREAPRDRPLIDAAFDEHGEGRTPAAGAADGLAALGGQRDRDRSEWGDADPGGELAAAGAADRRRAAERRGEQRRDIISQPRTRLAAAQGSAGRQRGRPRPAAQQCPGGQLQPIEACLQRRLRQALLGYGGRRAAGRHRRRGHARQRPLIELRDRCIEYRGRLGGDLREPAAPGSRERRWNEGRSPRGAHRVIIDRHGGGDRGRDRSRLTGRHGLGGRRLHHFGAGRLDRRKLGRDDGRNIGRGDAARRRRGPPESEGLGPRQGPERRRAKGGPADHGQRQEAERRAHCASSVGKM